MSYQQSILKRYKEAFPKHTLKTISARTGVQMTRVFRLFNGAEMKLKEYEAFERCIRANSLGDSKLRVLEKVQSCLDAMPANDLNYFETEINHLLKIDKFVNQSQFAGAAIPTAL